MNITSKRQSLPLLWLKSFAVVNRSVGKLLGLIGVSVVVWGILIGIAYFALGGASGLMEKVMAAKAGTTSGVMGLIGVFGVYIGAMLFLNIYSVFFFTVLTRIFAAEALQQKLPFGKYFSSSVIPTLWQIVLGIIIGIPVAILGILAAIIFPGGPMVFFMLLVVGLFTIGVRLAYTYLAIILKKQGPIEALKYSWTLTDGAYVDTLLMLIMGALTGILIRFVIQGMFYGLKVGIPLYFANSFSFTSPFWWAVGLVVMAICVFLYLIPMAFPVLVFLNRDAGYDVRSYTRPQPEQPLPGVFPAAEIPAAAPAPVDENYVEEGLPPDTTHSVAQQPVEQQTAPQTTVQTMEQMPPLAVQQQAAQQILSQPVDDPQPQKLDEIPGMMSLEDMPTQPQPTSQQVPQEQKKALPVEPVATLNTIENLELSQSSIDTSEETVRTVTQHLDQVYTPAAEQIVQRGDEDRMPTIVFDEEMTEQLEKSVRAQSIGQDQPDSSQDSGTIKLSK